MNDLDNFKKQVSNIIYEVIKPTFKNIIALFSYSLLFIQFIVDILRIENKFLEENRTIIIWISSFIILTSFIYYLLKSKYREAERRLQKQLDQLKSESKELRTQIVESTDFLRTLKKVKDPKKDIDEKLTYNDIEFSIYCLTNKLVQSHFLIFTDNEGKKCDAEKNLIIGIDRGGAILGGLLGKSLRLTVKTLGIYYASPPLTVQGERTAIESGKCLENIKFSKVKKVLLVDDAIRTGKSMEAAIKLIKDKKKEYEFDYIIVCILDNPYVRARKVKPDFFVYKTHDIDLKMPWDINSDTIQINKDVEELCK